MYDILDKPAYEGLLCLFNFWIKIPMAFSWDNEAGPQRPKAIGPALIGVCPAYSSLGRSTGDMIRTVMEKVKGTLLVPIISHLAFSQVEYRKGRRYGPTK
jgi:hypothetical protein